VICPSGSRRSRNTLAWSYDLLGSVERAIFQRLAVFVGGCTLEAVEAVCADAVAARLVLDGLAALVDHSLLRHVSQAAGEARFEMLETVREYARERLEATEEGEALQDAHADYFLALAEQAAPALFGSDQAAWLARLAREQGNLRAALSWWRARDPERGLRLAAALGWFWRLHGDLEEGRVWLTGLVRASGARTPTAGKALAAAALLAWLQRDNTAARALAAEGVDLCRQLGDVRGLVEALREACRTAYQAGDLAAAERAGAESLALARALDDRTGIGRALDVLGSAARCANDYARAAELHGEALALFRDLCDTTGIAVQLSRLGYVAQAQGDLAGARGRYAESLALLRPLGNDYLAGRCLAGLAGVAAAAGEWRRAGRLFGVTAALMGVLGTDLGAADRALHDQRLAETRAALGEVAFSLAWGEGQALSLPAAIAEELTGAEASLTAGA
jgi:hypothetical protein